MASRKQKITVAVEDVVKKEPLYTVGENVNWSHHFMAYRWGKDRNSDRIYFLGLQSLWTVTTDMK